MRWGEEVFVVDAGGFGFFATFSVGVLGGYPCVCSVVLRHPGFLSGVFELPMSQKVRFHKED